MLIDIRFIRQEGAVDMRRLAALPITVIGAGAIGSTTCFWLGKMGITKLRVFDGDIVKTHNWSSQFYRNSDFGRLKAEVLVEVMEAYGAVTPTVITERYTDQPLTEVVISAVDSMRSRKAIWRQLRNHSEVQHYIDARMGLETLVVHTVRPQLREERMIYARTLYNDNEALDEPCTARTICYTPLMAAAVVCNLVKRYVNGEAVPGSIVIDLTTHTMLTDRLIQTALSVKRTG